MKKLHLKTSLLLFLLVSGMISFSPMTKAASVVLESAPKNFTNNSSPLYGNISWDSRIGIGGVFSGSAIAGITNPITVAVDSLNDVYAIDGSNVLKKYSNATWSNFSPAPTLTSPKDMKIDPAGNIYIVDYAANNIKKYTKSLNAWSVIGNDASPALSQPSSIAFDSVGNIYIADSSIRKYDVGTGSWSQVVNAGSQTADTFNRGIDTYGVLAFDSADNLYWVDNYSSSYRVHKRTPQGVFSYVSVGAPGYGFLLLDKKGDIYVGGSKISKLVNGSWVDLALAGSTATTVNNPYAMALDSDGNFYTVSVTGSFKFQKFISGTSIKMQVRTGDDASMLNAADWASVCEVKNNSDINTCANGTVNVSVVDEKPFVQYRAVLSADTGLNTPRLNSVKIETQKTYTTNFGSSYLISSVFNTDNPFNKLKSVSWNATNNGSTSGLVGFQFRTSSDGATWRPWCGPSSCAATNGTSDFADSFYQTTAAGETIAADAGGLGYGQADPNDPNKNKYFQYATFLRANNQLDVAAAVPTLNSVSVAYSFNVPPIIRNYADGSNPVLSVSQNTSSVDVPYRISEMVDSDTPPAVNSTRAYASLFYQPAAVVELPVGGIAADFLGDITLINPANAPVPSQGTMLVDNELISFNNNPTNGNTITITGRGVSFDAGTTYKTKAVAHTTANTKVFFKATAKSGGGLLDQETVDFSVASPMKQKTFNWDARNDQYLGLNGKTTPNMTLKVVANDAADPTTAANIGESGLTSGQTVDLKAPSVTSVTTTKANGDYKSGQSIPLTINFSESIVFSTQVTVNFNGGAKCTTADGITASAGAGINSIDCDYIVGSGDNTPAGEFLKVSSITSTNPITDIYGNVVLTNDFIVPTDQNLNGKQIVIDNVPPSYSDLLVRLEKAIFTQGLTTTDNTSGYTYAWTKTDGVGTVTFGSPASSSTTIATVDGTYVIQVAITDKAGNVTTKTMNLIWDTVNPSDAGAPNVPAITKDNTPQITWTKATDLNGIKKYEVYRSDNGADGNFQLASTINNPANADQTYIESEIPDGTYFYKIVASDIVDNTSTSAVSTGMRIDTVPAALTNFTTTNDERFLDGTAPNEAYGTNAVINITANFNEPVVDGSTVMVVLKNGATPAVEVPLSAVSGSTISGSFTVQGPRKGYDTANQEIERIKSINVTDLADNVQSDAVNSLPGDKTLGKNIAIDTGTPVLLRFDAVKSGTSISSGSFKSGDQLTITASYSKTLTSGNLAVRLNANNGGEDFEDINLSLVGGVPSTKLVGTYNVIDGDNVDSLNVFSILSQNVVDQKGNPLVTSEKISITDYDTANASVVPPIDAIINISGIQIDTAPPVVTVANEADDVDQGPVQSDAIKVHVEEVNPVAYKYIFSSDTNCASKSYDAGTIFANDESLEFSTQDNNGKYICAQIDDLAGNKVYWASSRVLNIDRLKPTGSMKVDSSKDVEVALEAADSERPASDLQMQVVVNDDINANCDFTNASWETYSGAKDLNGVNSDIKVCVQYKDVAGNISDLITAITPETPSNVKVSDTSNLSATPAIRRGLISWQVPTQLGSGWKNAEVDSCNVPEADADCDPTAPIANPSSILTNQQDNFYVHSNLVAGKKYCYRVKFSDTNDDISLYGERKCFIPGADMTPADILAPVVANVLPSSGNYIKDGHVDFTLSEALQPGAKIIFTSSTAANSEIIGATHEYALVDSELTITDPQTKIVDGLVDGNTYKLKFTGSDLAGNPLNFTEITNIHFDSTLPTVNDVTPGVNAMIKDGTVTFTLSEPLHDGAKIVFTSTTANNETIGAEHEYVLTGGELATTTPQTKIVQRLVSGNVYSLRFEGSDLAWNFMNFSEITGINFDSNAPTISENLSVSASEFSPNVDGIKDTVDLSFKSNKAGTYSIALSGNGKTATLSGNMEADIVKSHNWDGKNASAQVFSDGNVSATLTITDIAGNSTTGNPISFKVDTTAPIGTFSINSNAQITISADVTLNSGVSDDGSGLSMMSFSNDNSNWSALEAYSATKSWTLPGGDGEKTVYARYEDKAGNAYSQSDIINLNTNSLSISFVGADGDVNSALNNSDHISIRIDGINIANAAYGYTNGVCDSSVDGDISNQITGTANLRTKIFDVADQNVNGKYLCVRADDGGSNVEYKISGSAFNIDSTKPSVSFTDNVDGNLAKSEDVIIHAEDANLDTTSYAFAAGNCDANQDFSNTFVSDLKFTIDTEHPDQYICARAVDRAGNVEYLKSANKLNIDATAPVGTVSIDRAVMEGKVSVILKPVDLGGFSGMKASVQLLETNSACNFNSPVEIDITGESTTGIFDDSSSSIKKVCVKFTDGQGNVSDVVSALTPETPQVVNIRDISNVAATPAFRGAMISWQAPVVQGSGSLKNAEVDFCKGAVGDADCLATEPVAIPSSIITDSSQTYYVHNDLDDAKYCYRVKFLDTFDNRSAYSESKCFIPGTGETVETQAAIQDVSIDDITKTDARISFRTVDSATGNSALPTRAYVEAYDNSSFSGDAKAVTTLESAYSVDHIIKLTVPTSPNPYYLKIVVMDSAGKITTPAYDQINNPELTFTTLGILMKINIDLSKQPRVISDTAAVIEFTTDQRAVCFIENGTTTGTYAGTPTKPESVFVQNHSIHIEGLLPLTNYFFKVTCSGDEGTTISSPEGSFKTLEKNKVGETGDSIDKSAPEISNVALANVTGENATITWNTQEVASSSLAYEVEGTDFMLMSGDYLVNADVSKYATTHTVQLKGLLPASKYSFTVLSTDASGNIGQSSPSTFTTKEPSSISSIKVISKALGQATITWETGGATTSLVEYGLTTAYGQKKEDSARTKEHSITLSDLTPGETYHFRVKGDDAEKNIFASSDITFQTKAPPKISDFKVDSVSEHSAVITFNTNVSTDAIVNFENTNKPEDTGFQGRPDFVSRHEIKLKDLTSGSTFSIKLKVRDEDGNETQETFPSFTTTKDEVPPKIDRVKTDSALTQNDKVQAIISWSTDELSTGEILYKEGRTGDDKKFEVNSAPSFSHIGVITSFKSGVVYYFKVRSTDPAGNTVTSSDYALLTPKQRQNIIQVIIGNFTDIFGWAKF